MKRIKYFFLFVLLSVCGLSAQELNAEMEDFSFESYANSATVRIAVVNLTGSVSNATIHVSSPISGTISTTGSNSLVGTPLQIGSNLVMLAFFYTGPSCNLQITNSLHGDLQYSETVRVSSSASFQDAVPINPNGSTTISIQMVN